MNAWTRTAIAAWMLVLGCDGDASMMEPDAGPPAACDETTLCDRALDDCAVTTIDREQCLAFYDPAMSSCRDAAAYERCNCDCAATTRSCGPWFACGEECFAVHCE